MAGLLNSCWPHMASDWLLIEELVSDGLVVVLKSRELIGQGQIWTLVDKITPIFAFFNICMYLRCVAFKEKVILKISKLSLKAKNKNKRPDAKLWNHAAGVKVWTLGLT